MIGMAEFAVRSSWGAIGASWHLWVLIIAFAYALILIAAWAIIHGGASKPTPKLDRRRVDALRGMGDEADRIYRDDDGGPRVEWTPGGGWRLR